MLVHWLQQQFGVAKPLSDRSVAARAEIVIESRAHLPPEGKH